MFTMLISLEEELKLYADLPVGLARGHAIGATRGLRDSPVLYTSFFESIPLADLAADYLESYAIQKDMDVSYFMDWNLILCNFTGVLDGQA